MARLFGSEFILCSFQGFRFAFAELAEVLPGQRWDRRPGSSWPAVPRSTSSFVLVGSTSWTSSSSPGTFRLVMWWVDKPDVTKTSQSNSALYSCSLWSVAHDERFTVWIKTFNVQTPLETPSLAEWEVSLHLVTVNILSFIPVTVFSVILFFDFDYFYCFSSSVYLFWLWLLFLIFFSLIYIFLNIFF